MNKKIVVFAPSKINLYLNVMGLTKEGFHTLETVMQTTTLGDEVIITLSPSLDFSVSLTSTDKSLPLGDKNICYKVAMAFQQATKVTGKLDIHIVKNTPSQGGLGGGSGDGAAVLVGLNQLFDTGISQPFLCDIASPIGKDIPFCIVGGTGLGLGFGEKIRPLPPLPLCTIVICKPKEGVSTPEAFRRLDEMENRGRKPSIDRVIKGLSSRDLPMIGSGLYNDFERVVGNEDTEYIQSVYRKHGSLGHVLSGSGSSVVGLFEGEKQGKKVAEELGKFYPFIYVGQPYPNGATIKNQLN